MDVYADVACPFAHVGLRRFVAARDARGLREPLLRVRAWPLELVNGAPHSGAAFAPKVAALREHVAPDAFRGFDPESFPTSSLAALAAEAAAHRAGPAVGEAFSLAVRDALYEHGVDIADPARLRELAEACAAPMATAEDADEVRRDLAEGARRGVVGSPHFFTSDGSSFFCPSLDIAHDGGELDVRFDVDGFTSFLDVALAHD